MYKRQTVYTAATACTNRIIPKAQNKIRTGKSTVHFFAFASVHQFRLVFYKRKHPTDIVGYPEREKSNDNDEEQHPPEAQVFNKLLPRCAETGKNSFALL